VIVDVLAMFKPVRGGKETLYEADYNALKGLQELAGEHGIAILVITHTRKSGSESGDAVEKITSTLGTTGAADAFLVLDRDGQGCTLEGRGREVEEIEVAVTFDRDACRWTIQGQAVEVRRSDERGQILSVLIEAEEPVRSSEIAIALGKPRNAVDQLLYKMAKAGEVLKTGRGLYVHPNRADLAEAPPTSRKNDKKVRNEVLVEGRFISRLEKRSPGAVRRVLDRLLAEGREPNREALMAALRKLDEGDDEV
jgi:hypothetical protein